MPEINWDFQRKQLTDTLAMHDRNPDFCSDLFTVGPCPDCGKRMLFPTTEAKKTMLETCGSVYQECPWCETQHLSQE